MSAPIQLRREQFHNQSYRQCFLYKTIDQKCGSRKGRFLQIHLLLLYNDINVLPGIQLFCKKTPWTNFNGFNSASSKVTNAPLFEKGKFCDISFGPK